MREEEMNCRRTFLLHAMPCLVGAALVGLQPATVEALTDGATAFIGTGTASPGLSLTPNAQSVGGGGTLAGAVVVGTSPVAVVDSCTFSGSTDIQSTLVQS